MKNIKWLLSITLVLSFFTMGCSNNEDATKQIKSGSSDKSYVGDSEVVLEKNFFISDEELIEYKEVQNKVRQQLENQEDENNVTKIH